MKTIYLAGSIKLTKVLNLPRNISLVGCDAQHPAPPGVTVARDEEELLAAIHELSGKPEDPSA